MVRKAASISRKKRELRAERDTDMADAVAACRKAASIPGSNKDKPSINSIALHFKVSPKTLGRHLNGGVSISEFNARKRHLSAAEDDVLLEFTKDQAMRGFPLTHRLIKDRATAILRVGKGPHFELGGMWVSRFLERNRDELGVYWSRPLDRSRASGLNPVAVGWYFDTLEKLDREQHIPAENWYAADESGVALGLATKMLVIGLAGQKVQHKQQDGEREIVTVMETICADGSLLRPTVVFKGQNLLAKWGRYNPCDASIGVGPNGYMDSELALKYLKEFHQQTKDKNKFPRVLMVDGHASHCSLAFLDLAVEFGIFVVSYPPHTTHRLQGLDVVIFAVLKFHWQLLRDARERASGIPVKKEDFLAVYTPARTATFTSALIVKAFRKTGAYPVDRNAVSEEEMVPSQETTNQTIFPAHLASPVKAVLAAHRIDFTPANPPDEETSQSLPGASASADPFDTAPPTSLPDPAQFSPSKRARVLNFLLEKTSASFLLQKGVEPAEGAAIPSPIFERPGQELVPNWQLLRHPIPADASSQKAFSVKILTELGRAKAYGAVVQSCLEASNAQLVLAHLEIARLTAALKEAKGRGKLKNNRAKLMSSGAARLLTSDEFRDALREDEAVKVAKVAKQAVLQQARSLARAKKDWRKQDVADRKEARAEQLEKWEKSCESARRVRKTMPKKPKPPVRPNTPDDAFFLEEDDDEEEDEDEEEEDVSDDDEDEE